MHPLPLSTCPSHVTLCTKCELLQFEIVFRHKNNFTIKICGDSRFILQKTEKSTNDYEASSQQVKSEFASQNCHVISVSKIKTPSFPRFSIMSRTAARCYKFWNKCHQFMQCMTFAGLDTSSGLEENRSLQLAIKTEDSNHLSIIMIMYNRTLKKRNLFDGYFPLP